MKSSVLLILVGCFLFVLTYRCWNEVVGKRVIALVDRERIMTSSRFTFRGHSSRDAITSPLYGIELCNGVY